MLCSAKIFARIPILRRETESLDSAKEQDLGIIERDDPEDVGRVGEAAGDGEVEAPVTCCEDVEEDPDGGASAEAGKEGAALAPGVG